ncbi:MAG: sulfite exporter TauE/SafE family protein [Pseudomonadota bacterium]
MEWTWILLHVAAALASFFQSVTGVGFGMIAGPVILMVVGDTAAVVVSTLLSWLVAVVLFPLLRRGADWQMAGRLSLGVVLGLPFGLWLLAAADITGLKLVAGCVMSLLIAMTVFGAPGMRTQHKTGDLAFGALGGVFGGALATPGPPAVVRANAVLSGKSEVRATMVAMFVIVWPVILTGQYLSIGINADILRITLYLTPATLAGIAVGNWAASRVSESLFRNVVLAILILTAAGLLIDALGEIA